MATKVYIGNLPDNCPPDSLRDMFSGYGVIRELDIIKNFAFVHFDRESDAAQAVKDLDNTKLLGQVITVQISKNKGRSSNSSRDRRDDRRPPRRGASNNGPSNDRGQNRAPPPPLGGILGPAPGPGAPLGGLGILSSLSAVNTLAAAAEQQRNMELEARQGRDREREQPNPDVRVRREVVHTRDVPNASKLGIANGYVIYERYYVDPSHPLLKGLPLPEFTRVTDTFVAPREPYHPDDIRRDSYNDIRDRSPLQDSRDYERERSMRDLDYSRGADYFDRR